MTRPSRLNSTFLASSAWVPTTMSISPEAAPSLTFFASLAVTRRERRPILIGKPSNRARNCCNAGGRAGWSGRPPPPASPPSPRRRRRATPPRSCRSRHRRRPAGPLACPRQVAQHIVDRPVLIVGFLVREAVDECRIARAVGLGHFAGAQRAFGGGGDQLTRDLADALLHLRLATLPRLAAQTVERRPVLARAIAGQDFEVFDRDIELVAARIG